MLLHVETRFGQGDTLVCLAWSLLPLTGSYAVGLVHSYYTNDG